jgi:hypothetical protein
MTANTVEVMEQGAEAFIRRRSASTEGWRLSHRQPDPRLHRAIVEQLQANIESPFPRRSRDPHLFVHTIVPGIGSQRLSGERRLIDQIRLPDAAFRFPIPERPLQLAIGSSQSRERCRVTDDDTHGLQDVIADIGRYPLLLQRLAEFVVRLGRLHPEIEVVDQERTQRDLLFSHPKVAQQCLDVGGSTSVEQRHDAGHDHDDRSDGADDRPDFRCDPPFPHRIHVARTRNR